MDTIFKTFKAETRGVDETEGILDMFIPVSTSSVDRDGEVVDPLAFKKTIPKFMKHPVLVASHDYRDLTNQIGEWKELKVEEVGIQGKPKYYVNAGNEQADWAYYLASKGVAAFSIGFIPKKWEDGDGEKTPRRTYKDIELLEISQVIIPSNREAIQSVRSKTVDPVICEVCDAAERELITKPEETDEYIRIPVDRGDHEGHRIRTIDISTEEGIKALYCGNCKKVITYLFAKSEGWTMAKAKAWVKEHGKNVTYWALKRNEANSLFPADYDDWLKMLPTVDEYPLSKETSQEEIVDEIDYLISLMDKEGIGDKVKTSLQDLAKRIPGSDIPVNIETHKAQENNQTEMDNSITYNEIKESIKRILGG